MKFGSIVSLLTQKSSDSDNINTDSIYAGSFCCFSLNIYMSVCINNCIGKYTYQDNIPKETMAEVCMENYDSAFRTIAREGDILVVPYNFGCGSSREQVYYF